MMNRLGKKVLVLLVAALLMVSGLSVAYAADMTTEEQYEETMLLMADAMEVVADGFVAIAEAKIDDDELAVMEASVLSAEAVELMVVIAEDAAELATDLAWDALGVEATSGITIDDIMATADRSYDFGEAMELIDEDAAIAAYELAATLYLKISEAADYFADADEMLALVDELGDEDIDWAVAFASRTVEDLLASAEGLYDSAEELRDALGYEVVEEIIAE